MIKKTDFYTKQKYTNNQKRDTHGYLWGLRVEIRSVG